MTLVFYLWFVYKHGVVIITTTWSNRLINPTGHSDVYLRTINQGRRKLEASIDPYPPLTCCSVLIFLHVHAKHGFMLSGVLMSLPQNSTTNAQGRKWEFHSKMLSGCACEKLDLFPSGTNQHIGVWNRNWSISELETKMFDSGCCRLDTATNPFTCPTPHWKEGVYMPLPWIWEAPW